MTRRTRMRRGLPLAAALTVAGAGLLLIVSQLYTLAYANGVAGPLVAGALLAVYTVASYLMTPRRDEAGG